MTRLEAARNGMKTYQAKPCRICGDVNRYTSVGKCVTCRKRYAMSIDSQVREIMNDKMVKVKVKGNGKVKATAITQSIAIIERSDDFELFWSAYPRKIGKTAARKAWQKAKDRPATDVILEAVEKAKQTEQWKKDGGQFIPHPTTWINQGRWHDEFLPDTTPDPNGFLAGMKAFIERG